MKWNFPLSVWAVQSNNLSLENWSRFCWNPLNLWPWKIECHMFLGNFWSPGQQNFCVYQNCSFRFRRQKPHLAYVIGRCRCWPQTTRSRQKRSLKTLGGEKWHQEAATGCNRFAFLLSTLAHRWSKQTGKVTLYQHLFCQSNAFFSKEQNPQIRFSQDVLLLGPEKNQSI